MASLQKYLNGPASFSAQFFSDLINQSFNQDVFPDYLKVAKVTPIPKSTNDKDVSNFKPISVLPVVSKLFEKAMYSRIYSYFESFNVFKRSQFG